MDVTGCGKPRLYGTDHSGPEADFIPPHGVIQSG